MSSYLQKSHYLMPFFNTQDTRFVHLLQTKKNRLIGAFTLYGRAIFNYIMRLIGDLFKVM